MYIYIIPLFLYVPSGSVYLILYRDIVWWEVKFFSNKVVPHKSQRGSRKSACHVMNAANATPLEVLRFVMLRNTIGEYLVQTMR